ncbi:hypothetical protein [Xanthobacter sp. KR7-225]|uniref:ImuA family protein n=1 Tax=Xanthobacter sp. KR7-225 TaxID=3156613 RepID=UPI0032B5272E
MTAQPEGAFAPRRSLAAATGVAVLASPPEPAGRAPVRMRPEGARAEGASSPAAALPAPAAAGGGAPHRREDPAPAALAALRGLCGSPAAAPARRHLLGAPLDAALGGGLPRGALHEMFCGAPGAHGAMLGFAAALAAGLGGPVVWVRQDMSVREGGRLYAPGCAELGLDPAFLVLVEAADAASVLRAAEDALRHAGPALVIAEPWGTARVLDLTATRRLALRAGERGALALLLRPGAEPEPSAAVTRWQVAPAGALCPLPFGLGPPAFALELVRSRLGPTGRWIVEWNAHARRFNPAAPGAAAFGRVPAAPFHRPAGDGGTPARRAAS